MQYVHVTLPRTSLSYAFKSNLRLACGNPNFLFPDSCLHWQNQAEMGEEFVYLFRALKVVQPNKHQCPTPALSGRIKQSKEGSQVNCKFADAGWASLWPGGCGRSTMLLGAAPTHWCHHHVAAPCHLGQRADHKCDFLTTKAQKNTELTLSKEWSRLHRSLISAGKNLVFINLVKGQLKHKQLNLPKSP